MELLKVYKDFKNNKKIKDKNLIEREIKESFDLTYKNGGIFILHHGKAIERLDKSVNIGEVISEINRIQVDAIEYEIG